MKAKAVIGDKEKHNIEARWSMGRQTVEVDGEEVIDKFSLAFGGDTERFSVGDEEPHDVRVKFSRGFPFTSKIEIHVDGKLVSKA